VKSTRRHSVGSLLLLSTLASGPAAAAFRCDSTTALTLVGLDTRSERALFALPASGSEPPWLLDADLAKGSARAVEETTAGRFGGSRGPGPILAGRRCGDRCLQVVRWRDDAWEPIGKSLTAPEASTLHLTYDREGVPWAAVQTVGEKDAIVAAVLRFDEGKWSMLGSFAVHGVGSSGLLPAPQGERGVSFGDAMFVEGQAPQRFVKTLPAGAGGEPLWLGGANAVFVAGDGLRTTSDGGATWRPVRWQALTGGEGDLAWKAGRDYEIELPEGVAADPFAAIWVDRRVADRATLDLATLDLAPNATSGWSVLLRTPDGILTGDGERLGYSHVIRFDGERWVLMTGCVSRPGGAALALRRFVDGKLTDPQLIRIEAPAEPTGEPTP
jgi:hypothetical protein